MSSSTTQPIAATDILQLIQAHLTQEGLHGASRALRQESGVGLKAPLHAAWYQWAVAGQWNLVLQSLSTLDLPENSNTKFIDLVAAVHEHVILELADAGDLPLAYALRRLADQHLQASTVYDQRTDQSMSCARRLDMILQDHYSNNSTQSTRNAQPLAPSAASSSSSYYPDGATRDQRRQALGQALVDAWTVQPPDRLVQLLQQAVQYQAWTGQLPQIQQLWHNDEKVDDKPKKKKRKRKVFDLVLGTVDAKSGHSSKRLSSHTTTTEPHACLEKPTLATVKFGKHAVCEAAVYTPDGGRLVTGSSDGLVEVWSTTDYQSVSTDHSDDEGTMGHEDAVTALAVANDGTLLASGTATGQVTIWRLDSGKALRQIHSAHTAIHTLVFCPDASRLLVCGGVYCREYGLRTAQCLREYHTQEVPLTTCGYYQMPGTLQTPKVWTAATDGRVRWYDATTAAYLYAWRVDPAARTVLGASVLTDDTSTASGNDMITTVPTVVAVLPFVSALSTTPCMVVVPRADRAYVVDVEQGTLVRVLQDTNSTDTAAICAAATSPGGGWLYAVRENGSCSIWELATGTLQANVSTVGAETIKGDVPAAEVTALVPHPSKAQVACFANDKRQKKGQLVVWK